MRTLNKQVLPVLIAVAGLIVVWGLIARFTDAPSYLLPAPGQVADVLWSDRAALGKHLAATAQIAVAGFALGVGVGIGVGVLLGWSATLRRAAEPLLIASQAIPPVILAPILIAAMGFGAWPKILVVTLGAFFPVAIGASVAMRDADRSLVDLMTAMGASRLTVLRQVRLPSSVPAIIAGAKVAASYVVFSAIIAEWMGSSIGLGVYLQRSQASYRMDQLFAAVGVVAALGVGLFWLSALLGELVLARSRPASSRKDTRS